MPLHAFPLQWSQQNSVVARRRDLHRCVPSQEVRQHTPDREVAGQHQVLHSPGSSSSEEPSKQPEISCCFDSRASADLFNKLGHDIHGTDAPPRRADHARGTAEKRQSQSTSTTKGNRPKAEGETSGTRQHRKAKKARAEERAPRSAAIRRPVEGPRGTKRRGENQEA